jgi:predicted dehydrogenase
MTVSHSGPARVGVIGCGNISGIYFENGRRFAGYEVISAADLDHSRAVAAQAKYGFAKAYSVDELLADPEVDLVLNLTIPAVHAAVGQQAIQAGKHVYAEKPLATDRADGQRLLDAAAGAGVRVGSAPDTFLGGGLQTCRKLIDDGAIGTPVAATAFMLGSGPESWHPNPAIFYAFGAGPMFDMGPYYLTALVSLLGPIRRVTGSARITRAQREIGSEPLKGQMIDVEVPTHIASVLDFQAGPVATLVTSFDVWAHETPRIEIYGTEGTLSVPDPNTFGGPVKLRKAGEEAWTEVPLTHGYANNSRGVGLADLAVALKSGRPQRASGELAFHVLDAMESIHVASAEDRHVLLESTCERPAALPVGLKDGEIDA